MEATVGGVTLFAGIILRILARLERQVEGIPPRSPRMPCKGPFRYCRHPEEVGSLLIIAGIGVAILGWAGVALLAPAWPAVRRT